MRKRFLTFLLLLISCYSFSQNWQWAKSGDGNGGQCFGICNDPSGNVFITGYYQNPSMAFLPFNLSAGGSTANSVYLTKYDANGNVLWARTSLGSQSDLGFSVSSDANGNAYVTGWFNSPTISFGSYTLTNSGGSKVFLTKYDANGNVLWAKSSGGLSDGAAYSVSTDANGISYITGRYTSSTISFDSFTLTNNTSENVFLTKYDSNGNVVWAKSSSGPSYGYGNSISTDASGNIYTTGYFTSPTITFDTSTLTASGGQNIYVTKYNPNGNLIWAKSPTGTTNAEAYSISTDGQGNSYVTGNFAGPSLTFETFTLTNTGWSNFFLTKYDVNGNVIWAKSAVGSGPFGNYAVTQNASGVYISGGYSSTITFDTYSLALPVGFVDPMFVAKYDLNGNFVSATPLTSGATNQSGICIDNSCNVYIGSDFVGSPFNFVVGSTTLTQTGNTRNPFVAKMTFACPSVEVKEQATDLDKISLYPNPTTEMINIEWEISNDEATKNNWRIEIINALGQVVNKEELFLRNKTTPVDLKDLPNGVYLLNFKGVNSQTINKRFVIAR